MAQPWEWLNKYLRGTELSTVDGSIQTEGLFGKGGTYGQGGLFTTPPEDPGKGMLNLFSNLPAVTGMEIIQKGFEGKPIEQTLMPAFKSGLVTTSAVEKVKASKRKQKFIKDYKDQVPEKDMELFLAFPEKYVSAILMERVKTPTLSKEAWALYTEAKKHGSGDEFKEWFETLSQADQDLYNKQIRPVRGRLEAILKQGAKADEKKRKGSGKETKVITKDKITQYRVQFESDNPGQIITDELIIKDLIENYGYTQ